MNLTSIIWGIILIFLGLAIIASKAGYLPPGFWLRLADFWPFIFIIIGLSIIARSVKKKLPFVIIIIALIIIPFIIAIINPISYTIRGERSEDIAVPFDSSIEGVWLTIDSGAGNFKVSGGSKDIASGSFSSNYARLVKDITKIDKRLDIKYKTEGVFKRDVVISSGKTEMELFLNDNIPYTITLNLGASKLDIDLSSIILKELKIDAGASSIDLKLGEKNPLQYITIKAGASDIDIRVPMNSGIRIKFDDGLTTKRFHDLELIQIDKTYESKDYQSKMNKIEMIISSGVSSIDIYGY